MGVHDDPDVILLQAAKERARERVEKDPSDEALAAFERASRMLEARMKPEAEPRYANRIEALKALRRQGYKIGKSKLYADCAAGRLKLDADGAVLERELAAYVRRVGLDRPADDGGDEIAGLDLERKRLEVQRLEEQVTKFRFEREALEGRHIPRDQVEMEIAGRAAVMESMLNNAIASLGRERRIMEPSGEEVLVAVIEVAELRDEVGAMLDVYATTGEFQVLFGGEG